MTETTQHKSNTPIEWGQAEGFSKYLISTDGQVYSLKRDRLLPQGFTERGYKQVDVCNDEGVFCKPFLHKIAKTFCRLLHLHFVGNCKTSAGSYSASHKPLQSIFNCYNTRYGNGSSEFSSLRACSLK